MKSNGYFEFPAAKGIQAGRPYYIAMCPLYLVTKFLTYSDNTLPSDMRVQRILNKHRIPEMRDYVKNNRDSYGVLNAVESRIKRGFYKNEEDALQYATSKFSRKKAMGAAYDLRAEADCASVIPPGTMGDVNEVK